MFSNSINSFIVLSIYLLIAVDISLLVAIYFVIFRDELKKSLHKRAVNRIKPEVVSYINNDKNALILNKLLNKKIYKNVAIDIMTRHAEDKDIDISKKFQKLGLDVFMLKRFEKTKSITDLKKLICIRTESAYTTLLETCDSDSFDMKYLSFWGLSLLGLSTDKKKAIIHKLIKANLMWDRSIEIVDRLNLSFGECLELLKTEKERHGRIILIKSMALRSEIREVENADKLLDFLSDDKEIKIAIIKAIACNKNRKYIDYFSSVYDIEDDFEVRAVISKVLGGYEFKYVQTLLLKIAQDKNWVVRYNAVKSIVAMGEEGLYTIIDLYLENDEKNISDLAYYFLNSNKDVYNIVKKIGDDTWKS